MSDESKIISGRKGEHIKLSLSDDADYDSVTNGFENYQFVHHAATETVIDEIGFEAKFFSKKVDYPFIISSMTGGAKEANNINERLAEVAKALNIPIGVGSQRRSLLDNKFDRSYKSLRRIGGAIPILGNIGAAQIVKSKNIIDDINYLIDLIEADAMVIHLNPLQELLQPEGEPNFKGLLKKIEKITAKIKTPVIAKEVGAGIDPDSAVKLLEAGVKGIDVAGAGGTNWAKIELMRSGNQSFLSEWGNPTSYCLRTIKKLKKNYKFVLISSGGLRKSVDYAKSYALGADFTAAAKPILKLVVEKDELAAVDYIKNLFEDIKKIMYLTGCKNLSDLQKNKLINKSEFH
ncbi:isopentenyl pyrophosphate isomerase [Melioribacter roseus P3M-2]|uniref:Isopentenyl-diphosphate delta-isomerase n=1 Tax=Melioribacter roseus (strain DSM 23840 / JCM 17771 / VKM B-2668 / P3M-2) TaxID=1191523 RepID=I6YZ07_MELRP|nr:type 2 isopentenyl-diphosphate Delta-isomerase [Melioribacter roseus]AFN75812.1 isopentenyl pyrophosphate isomerase [Melioribacter roseus P3M-2]